MGDQSLRFIPINQLESAYQAKPDALLAQTVYKDLLGFIADAQKRAVAARGENLSLDKCRSHSAILLDGKRGTGKSSVLVNLPMFLEGQKQELDWVARVHVLKPVDPTLLEDHDDLFLNVIVAAILSDAKVKAAQEKNEHSRKALALQLQRLGHALEKMQSQDNTKGLDKLRAFMGNQQLVEEVHLFFELVLKLIGKDLLVLTVDDVDTSLSKAFENLEIVRRYLTSPAVLPVISGDGILYEELTWRDFHGRITEDSKYRTEVAFQHAKELSAEYQRKVLPFQYRLRMPEVITYLSDDNIYLSEIGNDANKKIQLRAFHEWVNVFLAGPVNGAENSQFRLPLESVRAVSQLIFSCRNLIPKLPSCFFAAQERGDIEHAYQMPMVPRSVIREFEAQYKEASRKRKREYGDAYAAFSKALNGVEGNAQQLLPDDQVDAWCETLKDYFSYERHGGDAFLVLCAQQHWYRDDAGTMGIFDTLLFQPQRQSSNELAVFEKSYKLDGWKKSLEDRLPREWLIRLPRASILPCPVPEVGGRIKRGFKFDRPVVQGFVLVSALMLNLNYYSNTLRGRIVSIGRLLELVIMSLVKAVDVEDIRRLLARPPFYSTASVAATKVQYDQSSDEDDEEGFDTIIEYDDYIDGIDQLAVKLNQWRDRHGFSARRVSPWFVYNVVNKVMNQAWFYNPPTNTALNEEQVLSIARQAFNSIWAAFGSFEKGRLFGLPPLIATVNISDRKSFESSMLYTMNVQPFYPRESAAFGGVMDSDVSDISDFSEAVMRFGQATGSITYALGDHPLRGVIEGTESHDWRPNAAAVSSWIKARLGLDGKVNINAIKAGLRKTFADREGVEKFHEELRAEFKYLPEIYERQVEAAIRQVLTLKAYKA